MRSAVRRSFVVPAIVPNSSRAIVGPAPGHPTVTGSRFAVDPVLRTVLPELGHLRGPPGAVQVLDQVVQGDDSGHRDAECHLNLLDRGTAALAALLTVEREGDAGERRAGRADEPGRVADSGARRD